MKTNIIKTAIATLLIAGGTISAFAFAKADKENNNKEAALHWFDSSTGDYLGERTQEDQQENCGTPGSLECARGYESIDENGLPVGSPVEYTSKQ
ncbi:hypothetical protein [Elizabethkingia bruuniana]|uniref:hypothetical protein n=1 Tax=Elizabethkingia bruuniana TaxID=1756149 RepID=UPI001055C62B|nr:hypothetical protein [Elizabethkingia bruuniana]